MEYSTIIQRILIIEDNPGDFFLINEYLNEEFFKPVIEQATTFITAKERLQSNTHFHSILLDLSLPDANGERLINEMVELAGSTPIIVLTGYSDKDFGIKTLGLGISDYLLKDELTATQLYKSIAYSIERMRITNKLKESEENYRNLFDISPIPMWVYNWESTRFLNVNKATVEHFGYSKQEFLSMTLSDITPPEDIRKLEESLKVISTEKGFNKSIFRYLKKNKELIDVEMHSDVYSIEHKLRLVLCNDITVSIYQKNILALEKEVYKLNATEDISFSEVLDTLTKNIEILMPGSSCTVLQKNQDNTFKTLSGGSMPKAFLTAIEAGNVGPLACSCGNTLQAGQNSIVPDMEADSAWHDYYQQIAPHGFKACWSVPIKKNDGKIIGGFAAYFKTIKHPLPHNINLLERAASLLGILIENSTAIEDIRLWNERYNIVAKVTSDVIWDWNFATKQILWNKGLQTILGYNEVNDTTTADWWTGKMHKQDFKRVRDNIQYHINNKILKWQQEYRFLCGDGTYKYIFDRGFLIYDEKNNQAIRMIGAMQDITRQKEEEHHLKLLESVITNTTDAVMITNVNHEDYTDHKIIYTNEAFTQMTGYTREEVIGKNPTIFQGPKTNRVELIRLKKAVQNWETCEIEVINYKKDGEEFWNNIAISPVADSTGWFTHWIAIERNITLRKRKDQEITRAIITTQEFERFQIGGELHDNVNQILAGVLLHLGMTKTTPVAEQAVWINQSIEYIHMAITEIRKLSHRLAPVSFDENSLKDTFEKLLKSINVDNRFNIKFSIDEVDHMQINGDIQLNLYRILQEQITNIMKYSKADVIEITLMLVTDAIRLRIYDNGVGFDIKKSKEGIGLNNIKKRSELFSGFYSLKSAPGKGCEVIVEIPIA